YSDKAVSRWERGEAIPDAYVLLEMAEIFGVTVDFILKEHTEEEFLPPPEEEEEPVIVPQEKNNRRLVTWVSFLGVWALSLLVFVIASIFGNYFWLAFIYAIPTSFTVLFILNCVWGKRPLSVFYLSIIVWGLLTSIHLSCLAAPQSWMLYLIGIPAQIIIPIAFAIGRKKDRKN
ncbi:MAG: helix-turn-helix transcriptional regulator, partial [Clostridia bacterium]|nr:helix-turn-helix transcriptional regulator [Clostridia bacterium]